MLPVSRPAAASPTSSSTEPTATRSILKSAPARQTSACITPMSIWNWCATKKAAAISIVTASRILHRSFQVMANFKFDVDADGIALLTWDMADRSMNVINADVIEELSKHVEKVATDAAIKGAVITSGKDAFCGGFRALVLHLAGATYAGKVKNEGAEAAAQFVFEESRKLSLVYRRLETSGKPWVCALNGTAMGGGFELALACHHRVAADNPKTRLGLPEIKVGLFPGAGGTQRIARVWQPAPGNRPTLISGRPSRVFGLSAATR